MGGAGGAGGAAVTNPYVGVQFWAVDLPNERGFNDAAAAPWEVLLSNAGAQDAHVVIERNDADPGAALSLAIETTVDVSAGDSVEVILPRREVTGWTSTTPDPPGPPTTWLSSAAYRITSDVPIAAAQLNTAQNAFANDGSLLVPQASLGTDYLVTGAPTANPITIGPAMAGVPDHTSVTIVGTEAGTSVTITAGHDLLGQGSTIPETDAGDTVTATLGPFDVLNLASRCEQTLCTGDLTGTRVTASAPVAVFTSGERLIAPWDATGLPTPPSYDGDHCCTEHMEEQMLPAGRYGTEYAVARSPVRSTGSYAEPDILRVLAASGTAHVQTSLAAPQDSFTLAAGEHRDLWTQANAVITADSPVIVSQVLVSQGFTESGNGDPSLTIVPPTDAHSTRAHFHVASSWQVSHVVITTPTSAEGALEIDGSSVAGTCSTEPICTTSHGAWSAVRCQVSEGAHVVEGAAPFSATVYGYGNVSSYAYAVGGSQLP
jgi:hypothetical protein